MNPLLDIIARDLAARGTAASALPHAPVVAHAPARTLVVRGRAGAALRALAHAVEPSQTRGMETAHHGRA